MKKNFLCPAMCLLLMGCGQPVSTASAPESVDTAPATTADTTSVTAAQTETAAAETTALTTTEAEADTLSPALFDALGSGIATELQPDTVIQTGAVNGQTYSLTIDLQKWAHLTSPEQIAVLSALFWECYPRMYERFQDLSHPPTDVVLAIENEGYEIAETAGNFIHLHDNWLSENPTDYDCITHELAHVIQNNCWAYDFLEYSDYIERFADCCRYEYAMQNGRYNDAVWTLQTVEDEPSRESSVRFLVWLDYFYSDEDTDILRRFFWVCCAMNYPTAEWGAAWQEIFAGTALAGTDIDAVWEMYAESDFAYLSSVSWDGTPSALLTQYDIRGGEPGLAFPYGRPSCARPSGG